jgi:hypothetical protein
VVAQRARRAEIFLAALVVASAAAAVAHALVKGYLPQPFYFLKSDTLMDWFNTAYWAQRTDAYERWGAVYPPLSLDFLKFFSLHGCYRVSAVAGRGCDWLGGAVLVGSYLASAVLAFAAFRAQDGKTALVRAVAFALGFPMLFALERGNLVLPCLALFILAEAKLVKAWWLRAAAFAVAVNFKPYLVVTGLSELVLRRPLRLVWALVASLAVYVLSYLVHGSGTPLQLVRNLHTFVGSAAANYWNTFYNPTSFVPLLDFIFFNAGFRAALPGWLLAAAPVALIGTMVVGLIGVLICYAATFLRHIEVPSSRLAAMALAVVLTATGASGYSEVFLVFLVFLEGWKNRGFGAALVGAYVLCISADLIVQPVPMPVMHSWLSGRDVAPVAGYAVGQVLRPALMFVVEFGLIAGTLLELRARLRQPAGERDGRNAQTTEQAADIGGAEALPARP